MACETMPSKRDLRLIDSIDILKCSYMPILILALSDVILLRNFLSCPPS